MCTSHPASARRISTPAHRNSASSGCARKLSATRRSLFIVCSLLLTAEPFVTPLFDERVVAEVRVGRVNSVDFFVLTRAQALIRVQAPDAFEQSLAAQHLVQSGDAPGKTVGGVEEGGV